MRLQLKPLRVLRAPLLLAAIGVEVGFLAVNARLPLPAPVESGIAQAREAARSVPWIAARFARDLSPSSTARAAPLGQLVAIRGAVRFRERESPVWEEPPVDGRLLPGQSLRTLEHASATVSLLDGSVLALGENSRLELAAGARPSQIALRLIAGAVQRRLASDTTATAPGASDRASYHPSLEISEPEAGIDVPPAGEFNLRRTTEGRLDLRVLGGEIGLRVATGNFLLKAGEQAIEVAGAAPGEFEFRKNAFVLRTPGAAETIAGPRARFEWNVDPALTGGSPLELQLSTDPAFDHPLKTMRIAGTEPPLRHVVTEFELPAGAPADRPWYWRVRAITDATVVSDAAFFWNGSSRRRAPTPALASNAGASDGGAEADDSKRPHLRLPLEAATATADQPLELVWAAVPGASGYEVDIEGRDQPIVTREVGVAVTASEIPAGHRSWRVRARLANADVSPWSEPRDLTVLPASAALPRRRPASHP